jgi:hypothetical protein
MTGHSKAKIRKTHVAVAQFLGFFLSANSQAKITGQKSIPVPAPKTAPSGSVGNIIAAER